MSTQNDVTFVSFALFRKWCAFLLRYVPAMHATLARRRDFPRGGHSKQLSCIRFHTSVSFEVWPNEASRFFFQCSEKGASCHTHCAWTDEGFVVHFVQRKEGVAKGALRVSSCYATLLSGDMGFDGFPSLFSVKETSGKKVPEERTEKGRPLRTGVSQLTSSGPKKRSTIVGGETPVML